MLYAIAFGSRVEGRGRRGSDLDIGIRYSTSGIDPYELGSLASRLTAATGIDVHLVDLAGAPASLRYVAFSKGVPILVRDRRALVNDIARAVDEYLDIQPMQRRVSEGIRRALLNAHARP